MLTGFKNLFSRKIAGQQEYKEAIRLWEKEVGIFQSGKDITQVNNAMTKICAKLEQSAQKGFARAAYCLGYFLLSATLSQNMLKLGSWRDKQRRENDVFILHAVCEQSNKPIEEVTDYLQTAAKQNYAHAQELLAWCYQDGIGVQADLTQATALYQKAMQSLGPDSFAAEQLKAITTASVRSSPSASASSVASSSNNRLQEAQKASGATISTTAGSKPSIRLLTAANAAGAAMDAAARRAFASRKNPSSSTPSLSQADTHSAVYQASTFRNTIASQARAEDQPPTYTEATEYTANTAPFAPPTYTEATEYTANITPSAPPMPAEADEDVLDGSATFFREQAAFRNMIREARVMKEVEVADKKREQQEYHPIVQQRTVAFSQKPQALPPYDSHFNSGSHANSGSAHADTNGQQAGLSMRI